MSISDFVNFEILLHTLKPKIFATFVVAGIFTIFHLEIVWSLLTRHTKFHAPNLPDLL